jgi:hypothetical protein
MCLARWSPGTDQRSSITRIRRQFKKFHNHFVIKTYWSWCCCWCSYWWRRSSRPCSRSGVFHLAASFTQETDVYINHRKHQPHKPRQQRQQSRITAGRSQFPLSGIQKARCHQQRKSGASTRRRAGNRRGNTPNAND